MGTIQHVYNQTVADGTATSVVRPSDWNSAHNYTLQDCVSLLTAGNTAGAMALVSSGTAYLAGGNNVTLSQNANSITISAAGSSLTAVNGMSLSTAGSTISIQPMMISEYQPDVQYGSIQTNSTFGQSSLYFMPFDLPWVLSASRVNVFVSIAQTYSGAPANSTAWIAMGYGLYTRGTGASTDRISLLTSYSMSLLSGSVSSSTRLSITHYLQLSNATSHSTSQYGQNNVTAPNYLSSSVAGFRAVAMPVNLTMTPGRYWFGFSQQSASQGASFILQMSVQQVQVSNVIAYRPFGTSSAASNASFYVPMPGMGSYSAQSAAWPNSIALTTNDIRASLNPQVPFFNFSGIDYNTSVM